MIDYYLNMYKDQIYHIYNRGNGKEKIFFNNNNYYYFLKQYHRYLFDLLDTFAYCLLKNHFHLLVRPKIDAPELISEQFRKFFISYSMAVNIQEKRKGNLFQRRFKRKLISDEKYFYSAVYYIHSNPVHHNIFKDLTQYKFSFYDSIINNNDDRLCVNEVFEWFGGKNNFIDYHQSKNDTYFCDELIIEDDY